MYKLLSISADEVTRSLLLKNIETGSQELCFDDSELMGFNNSSFMRVENLYECKILLFGDFDVNGEVFKFLSTDNIGSKSFLKVSNQSGDIYYVTPEDSNTRVWSKGEIIKYQYSRKDLIEVNGLVHPYIQNEDCW